MNKIFKITIGKILQKIYLYHLKTHNYIPSFLRTPFVLNKFAQLMFTYETDLVQFNKGDYQQTSIEMLNRRIGDCEDWVIVFKNLLLPKYNPEMYTITALKVEEGLKIFKRHRTCIFITPKYYYAYIDNTGYSIPITFYRITDIGKCLTKKVYGEKFEFFEILKVS